MISPMSASNYPKTFKGHIYGALLINSSPNKLGDSGEWPIKNPDLTSNSLGDESAQLPAVPFLFPGFFP